MSYDSYYRVPDDAIQELINVELSENEAPSDFEYMNALAYFRLSTYATEEEAKRTYRKMVQRCQRNENVLSNEIRKINANYDIIKKYFKHIKWQQNVRDKKVEIQNLMKNAISTENIDRNLKALTNKLKQIYDTFYRRIESERTIVGLNYLYNQYKNTLRQEYKNVLMYYGNIELDLSINTLQEFNNFLINLLNKNKLAFLEELDNEYNKYQNDESYRPLLEIIINLINESKSQVQSSSFINEKIKEDISTNLRTRINKLKENYLDIEGTLKYLQEFFAEIENHELGTKSKSLLDRLNNLQSEEELNQINTELEPLEQEAKEYERKKEQEEIDNYIKGLISKYNGLIQNASLEELQELTTKLGKICELISKGKSLNKDLAYYQNIETILDEEKTKEEKNETEPSPIVYIRRLKDEIDKEYQCENSEYFYLFYPNINKIECLVDDNFWGIGSRFDRGKLVDISQEELQRNFISLDDFFDNSTKLEVLSFLDEPTVYYTRSDHALQICKDDTGKLIRVSLKYLNNIDFIGGRKELEKESKEELRNISNEIKKYLEGKISRKKTTKLEISTSGIYIKKNNREKNTIYLFHKDINKLELIRLNSSLSFGEYDFYDITQEELEREYVSLEDFMINSKKYKHRRRKSPAYEYFDFESNILEVQMYVSYFLGIEIYHSSFLELRDKIETEFSTQEIEDLIKNIKEYVKAKSLRKKQPKEPSENFKKWAYLDGINPKLHNEIFGVEFNYGNDTSAKPKGGRTKGSNNDLNY